MNCKVKTLALVRFLYFRASEPFVIILLSLVPSYAYHHAWQALYRMHSACAWSSYHGYLSTVHINYSYFNSFESCFIVLSCMRIVGAARLKPLRQWTIFTNAYDMWFFIPRICNMTHLRIFIVIYYV